MYVDFQILNPFDSVVIYVAHFIAHKKLFCGNGCTKFG